MPRFLAPNARSGDLLEPDDEGRLSTHGYLSRPARPLQGGDSPETVAKIASATSMCDEPESLEGDQWSAHVDERAKVAEEQRRKFEAARVDQARRLLSFEERLTSTVVEAKRRHVDVSGEVRLLRDMQARGKQVRHLESRLGPLERKVFRELDEAA